ncbi:hypothetical protein OBBRIDRAFT_175726 [Obba rivulosa]|uniref:Uncharacterized protein n=1 Tax=Obba rivulosa TaxID=1052685 RepID=A0A8E2AM43_9APHY|nr:hypothetical protein OBBRIDRAFT_175726 [Obba rivulosa]
MLAEHQRNFSTAWQLLPHITNMCSKRLSTISNRDSLVVYIARLEGKTRDSAIGL